MPQSHRRSAITDFDVATRGFSMRSLKTMDYGTHAQSGYGGTVSFKHGGFVGTPTILIDPIGLNSYRLSGGGTVIPVRAISRYPGSFTYYGSPRHGTFQWVAIGSWVPNALVT